MISLSTSQLEKPYHSNHEFYGLYKDRGERFLEKIIKGEPFELTDGSSFIISKESPGVIYLQNKEYKELSGGKKLFITICDIKLSLSSFIKTEEFGSSSGQGAGSKNTEIQESSQCVFNSMIYSLKRDYLDVEDITMEMISSSYQHCDVTTPWEDVYEFSQIPSWQQTFLTSSNLLYQYNQEFDYEHHRGSEFIESLYDSYKKTDVGYQSDKWNPSDIWLVSNNALNTKFSASIDDINMQVKDMFDSKDLIGVSLKKTNKDTKLEIKNYDKDSKKKYSYEGHKTTYKSKDITLLYNEGKICFRTFNFATGWAGEILGKSASHGKIGIKPINRIIGKYGITLNSPKHIKSQWESNEYSLTSSLLLFYQKYINIMPKEKFDIFIQEKNIDWRVSKLLGLQLLSKIESQPKEIQNIIITEIINYASSETDDSSVFVKIS